MNDDVGWNDCAVAGGCAGDRAAFDRAASMLETFTGIGVLPPGGGEYALEPAPLIPVLGGEKAGVEGPPGATLVCEFACDEANVGRDAGGCSFPRFRIHTPMKQSSALCSGNSSPGSRSNGVGSGMLRCNGIT